MKILKVLTTLTIMALSFNVWAQNGVVTGTVTEEVDGNLQPAPFANVALFSVAGGAPLGGTTDFDGKYRVENVKPGDYTLVISFIGLKADSSKITVAAGQEVVKSVTLGKDAKVLKAFEIETKVSRESEAILLMDQKNASSIEQTIGAAEMSKKGASDVEAGLTKVTGVTVVTGSDLFVRGLGDRYNLAMMNDNPVPSPDPDLKVIPLSLIPTDIVQNISIDKTFKVDNFADYAGASIDIKTRDYPDDPTFKIELGLSGNSITTFQDFQAQNSGSADFFGIDGGNRDLPTEVENSRNFNTSLQETPIYPEGFKNGFNSPTNTAMPAMNFAASGGNYYKIGKEGGFGFFASAGIENDYQYTEGYDKLLIAQGAVKNDYNFQKYRYNTDKVGFLNANYRINKKHDIAYNLMAIQSTEQRSDEYTGFNGDQGQDLFTRRNTYFVNNLVNHQLTVTNKMMKNDRLILTWGGSYGIASSGEKDRNQLVWLLNENTGGYAINDLDVASNHRFYSDLQENILNAKADVQFKFNYISEKNDDSNRGVLQVGYNFYSKSREFDWRQVNYEILTSTPDNPLTEEMDVDNPDAYFNQENFDSKYFRFKEQLDATSFYDASLDINAGYLAVDYDVVPQKIKVSLGARVEQSYQLTRYKELGDKFSDPLRRAVLDTVNLFPMAGAKWTINKKSNLRFAASKTITRPRFREVARFQYEEKFGDVQNQGNPDLKNAYNYNVDVKYELFPNPGELIAFNPFFKYLDNPIERVRVSSSTPLQTYFNTDKAYIVGLEVEYTRNLGAMLKSADSSIMRNIFLGANLSLMYSEISIDTSASGSINVTNPTRPLQGATPLLVNADVTYRLRHKKNQEVGAKTDFTLAYNVFGKRIAAAGVNGMGDIYELSVNTLDFICKNKIDEHWSIDFKVMNILNPYIRQEQNTEAGDILVNRYKRGVDFAVKAVYNF
ncbi:carboxypeptidase regulatory-like domain-containing protein [bacterium SCSIO 12741]|nr:carboxypeptidase regulatory-like domain-containing protein [bacterium SCSIO 12741]